MVEIEGNEGGMWAADYLPPFVFVPEHLRHKACASTIFVVPRHTFFVRCTQKCPGTLFRVSIIMRLSRGLCHARKCQLEFSILCEKKRNDSRLPNGILHQKKRWIGEENLCLA
jgi:hypothetical protein